MSKYIDRIIYINLEYRKDRKEEIETELQNYDLLDKSERFEGFHLLERGLGCSKSHLAVLKLAKERGYKHVLILEDDFQFLVNKEEFEKQLTSFFESGLKYDVCMLSYILYNTIKEPILECPYVHKLLRAHTASGYIVNGDYLDKLIELYEWSCPLLEETKDYFNYINDQCWTVLQQKDNWFHFIERIGKQRPGFSDNDMMYLDLQC